MLKYTSETGGCKDKGCTELWMASTDSEGITNKCVVGQIYGMFAVLKIILAGPLLVLLYGNHPIKWRSTTLLLDSLYISWFEV